MNHQSGGVGLFPPNWLQHCRSMSRWNELIADERATVLRNLLHDAAAFAHAENAARFDAEVLGDDALIYGLMATSTARYHASRLVEAAEIDGVAVCERGRIWWLEVQRDDAAALRIYFYKAPPGATSIRGLRFDAEIKKELSSSNGRQMALFTSSGGVGSADLLNIVVVHFGDAVEALERLEVGAPYLVGTEVDWDWHERFDAEVATAENAVTMVLGDDDVEFGLRLVEPGGLDEDVADEAEDMPDDREVARATSEFEALKLVDTETAAEDGQEAT